MWSYAGGAGKVLELKPIVSMRPHGWDFIEKFVSRPYDVNIWA